MSTETPQVNLFHPQTLSSYTIYGFSTAATYLNKFGTKQIKQDHLWRGKAVQYLSFGMTITGYLLNSILSGVESVALLTTGIALGVLNQKVFPDSLILKTLSVKSIGYSANSALCFIHQIISLILRIEPKHYTINFFIDKLTFYFSALMSQVILSSILNIDLQIIAKGLNTHFVINGNSLLTKFVENITTDWEMFSIEGFTIEGVTIDKPFLENLVSLVSKNLVEKYTGEPLDIIALEKEFLNSLRKWTTENNLNKDLKEHLDQFSFSKLKDIEYLKTLWNLGKDVNYETLIEPFKFDSAILTPNTSKYLTDIKNHLITAYQTILGNETLLEYVGGKEEFTSLMNPLSLAYFTQYLEIEKFSESGNSCPKQFDLPRKEFNTRHDEIESALKLFNVLSNDEKNLLKRKLLQGSDCDFTKKGLSTEDSEDLDKLFKKICAIGDYLIKEKFMSGFTIVLPSKDTPIVTRNLFQEAINEAHASVEHKE